MDTDDVPGHHKLNPFSRTQHQALSMASYHRATPPDAAPATGLGSGHGGGGGGTGGVNSFTGMSTDAAERIDRIQGLLSKKLGPEFLSTRQGGGGTKLTYIEGWRVINLANEIFGFNGWYTEVKHLEVDFIDYNEESMRYNIGVSAIVRVWLRDGASHEDVGYGKLENSKSKADGLDKCKKEAVTDALKRTLRNFGSLLGNCLYDKHYTSEIAKMKAPKAKFDTKELHRPAGYKAPNAATAAAPPAETSTAAPPETKPVPQPRPPPVAARAPPQQQQQQQPPRAPAPVPRQQQAAPPPVARPIPQFQQPPAPNPHFRPQTADFFGADDDSMFAEVDLDASMYDEAVEGDSGYAEVPRELVKPVEEDPGAAERMQKAQLKKQQFNQQLAQKQQLAQQQLAQQQLAEQQQQQQYQQHLPPQPQRSSNPTPRQTIQRAATVPARPAVPAQPVARTSVTAAAMLTSNRPLGTSTSPRPLRPPQPPPRVPSHGTKGGPLVDPNVSRPTPRTPAQGGVVMGGTLPALNVGGAAGRVGVGVGGVGGLAERAGMGFKSARGVKRSGEEYVPTPPEGGRAPLEELGIEGGEVKRPRMD